MLDTSVRGRWEQYVHLHPAPGAPALAFQRVDNKSPGKNALHLDVHVTEERDVQPIVERALALGARLLERRQQDGASWIVLLDPEDNEFCVIAVGPLNE